MCVQGLVIVVLIVIHGVFVSVSRWCVFVSSVHPVIVRSAEFCIFFVICSCLCLI